MNTFDSAIQKIKPVTHQMELKGAASGSPDNLGDLEVSTNSLWGNYSAPSVTNLHHSGFTDPSYFRIKMQDYSSASIVVRNDFDAIVTVTVYAVLSEQDVPEYSAIQVTNATVVDEGERVVFSPDAETVAESGTASVYLPQTPCFALVVKLDTDSAPTSGECQMYISRTAIALSGSSFTLGQKPKDTSMPVVIASNQGALGSVSLTGNLPDTSAGDLARINPDVLSSDASLLGAGDTTGWEYSSHATNPTNGYGAFSFTQLDHANFNTNNYLSIDMAGREEIDFTIKSTLDVSLDLEIMAWLSGRATTYDALSIYSETITSGSVRSFTCCSLHASASANFVHLPQLKMAVAKFIISYRATSPTSGGLYIRMARR